MHSVSPELLNSESALKRADALFQEHRQRIFRSTDRLFAFLMAVQWMAGFVAAVVISPRTWNGSVGTIHPHIWASFLLGTAIASFPTILALNRPGEKITRYTMAAAQMMFSGLLIHLTGGRIETHFHVFGSLAFLAFYRDWTVFIPATAVVAADHLLRGIFFPMSVYGVFNASPWRTLEHAAWVLFEDAFLIRSCRMAVTEMHEIASQRARLEETNIIIDVRVKERTAELQSAQVALSETNRALEMARDQAIEGSRAKSVFVANMSHELRTPLNAILGYSEMLQEEALDIGQKSFVTDLKRINSAGRHLLSLINDILDLSKIEAGKMQVFLEQFQLEHVIQEVVETVRPMACKNGNTLSVDCRADVGSIYTDLTKIKQILLNLLSNACKFTHQGAVSLKTWRTTLEGEDWIAIQVTDTGIGMTPEQRQKLFKEFMQADASTTRKYGGTGLGLAISQHFSRAIGGNITVESVHGKGSCFTIRIPANAGKVSKQVEAPEDSNGTPIAADTTRRILVIDDDPLVRDLLKRTLSKEGFKVETAASGDEGLQLARKFMPEAITLDVMMPVKDGWSVLSELKADPKLQSIPVVIVSMVENQTMGFALGAAEYMTKPLDRDRLAAVLARLRKENRRGQVLIIEDDADLREMARRTLEKEGWLISLASDGKEGFARLAESRPDLILLDLMMPEMDGFEFISQIQKHETMRSIPIVVITARDLIPEERDRLTGHVQRVLLKGAYSREDLLREVRALVAAFRKQTAEKVTEALENRQAA